MLSKRYEDDLPELLEVRSGVVVGEFKFRLEDSVRLYEADSPRLGDGTRCRCRSAALLPYKHDA